MGEEGHKGNVPFSSVDMNLDHLTEVVNICQVSLLSSYTFPPSPYCTLCKEVITSSHT